MGCLRPATPGFLITLVATALLALVCFSVPWFQSIFFLKATLTSNGETGSITFGTLGYCISLAGTTTCSKPHIGYELDINALVGNKLPVQIPEVLVKWLTYALALHLVALLLAAGSAVFGLLAHVREMAMTCCSTCISGFAAVVALVAFIFDVALFFVAKARINKVPGGSATIGSAIWLTLIAWILLFISGCFYTLGRCCISNRAPRKKWDKEDGPTHVPGPKATYADQMRLDAVKAEADRKARQHQLEGGLPSFPESIPLTARVDGDEVYIDEPEGQGPYRDHRNIGGAGKQASQNAGQGTGYAAGYVQGPPGGRAVDQYYSQPNDKSSSAYPPSRQPSVAQSTYEPSNYSASNYAPSNYQYNPATAPPLPASNNPYLSPTQQFGGDRYGNISQDYGHTAGGTTYHSTVSHQPYGSNYSQYEAYDSSLQPQATADRNAYNNSPPQLYNTPYAEQHDRSYTLGGDSYGAHVLPPLPEHDLSHDSYFPYPGDTHPTTTSPAPINTAVVAQPSNISPVKGPRSPRSPVPEPDHDSPPSYESGPSQPPGVYGSKSGF